MGRSLLAHRFHCSQSMFFGCPCYLTRTEIAAQLCAGKDKELTALRVLRSSRTAENYSVISQSSAKPHH